MKYKVIDKGNQYVSIDTINPLAPDVIGSREYLFKRKSIYDGISENNGKYFRPEELLVYEEFYRSEDDENVIYEEDSCIDFNVNGKMFFCIAKKQNGELFLQYKSKDKLILKKIEDKKYFDKVFHLSFFDYKDKTIDEETIKLIKEKRKAQLA